jgi:hypothetical protein
MTITQSNYLNMSNAVLTLFDEHAPAWTDSVVVADGVQQFRTTVATIVTAATKQGDNDPKGHTAAKERARDELENLVYRTALRLRSYASKVGDDVLKSKTLYSRSDLDRLKQNDLLNCSRVILNVCIEKLPELSAYLIDQSTVDSLQQCIDRAGELYAHRDTVEDERMEATAHLGLLFDQARKNLKAIDDLIEGYVDDEEFVAAFFNARRIHDLRGRKK